MDISIIVPVYKVEKYIARCILSIMNQSCDNVQIECIIVDDCTPDKSVDVINELLSIYQGTIKFVIIHHEKNLGLSAARNTGIHKAVGEYVLFVDSDDHLPENALQKLVDSAFLFPYAQLIKGNYYSVKGQAPFPIKQHSVICINNAQLRRMLLNYEINCTAWNQLVKLDFIKNEDLTFVEGLLFEDTNWSYRAYRLIENAVLVPDITYIYEDDNPQSIMNTTVERAAASVNSIVYICNDIMSNLDVDYFVDCLLYVYTFVIKALNIRDKIEISAQVSNSLYRLRRRLIFRAIIRANLPLVLYFLLMYKPFFWIYRIGWVRRHNDNLEYGIRKISQKFAF